YASGSRHATWRRPGARLTDPGRRRGRYHRNDRGKTRRSPRLPSSGSFEEVVLAEGMERRRGPRLALDAAAVIRIESLDSPLTSRIVNASLNGLLLAMPAPRPVGTRMHITVRIGDPAYEISVSGII